MIRRNGANRSGGCLTFVVWVGILFNILLIVYSVNDKQSFSLASLWSFSTGEASTALSTFEDGNFDAAIERARITLSSTPDDGSALMTLTRALVYRSYTDFNHDSDLAAALDTATESASQYPSNPDMLAAYAFALQANGQGVAAANVAEQALRLDGNHTLARTALGLAYARVGSFETGLRESQAALTDAGDDPEAFDAQRAVAISMADLGNYETAGTVLDDLIKDHVNFIPLYYERALYARQVGDAQTAENSYLRVLTLDPENVKARLRLCELATRNGEKDSALNYCQQVTDMSPTLTDGWYRLGRLHYLNGDFKQAQDTLNRCSSLQILQDVPADERIFECWYLQGQAAEILGDCPALTTIYNQFQIMAATSDVRETWTYPPEGPPICNQ